jgi:hypothetical protein
VGNANIRMAAAFALMALGSGAFAADDRAPAADQFDKTVKPFLTKYCYDCHNSGYQSGDLDLESFQSAASVLGAHDRWDEVLYRLQKGVMPPKSAPRPAAEELKPVVEWIQAALAAAGPAQKQ